jgi:peptidoglycan hydrolase-like protein with peptidoglycan-binding domain
MSVPGRAFRRTVVTMTAVATISAVVNGAASADPGIRSIGPGPSTNTAGVRCIQSALHFTAAEIDGHYGEKTYQAVKQFQRMHSLPVDGAVGEQSGDKLLPSAPDGCIRYVPSTSSEPDWVSSPRPQPASVAEATDHLLFETTMSEFLQAKRDNLRGSELRWDDDGCSVPTKPIWKSEPGLFNFWNACAMHDFGYRNYTAQGRFAEDSRQRIDDNFKKDMNIECNKSKGVWAGRGVECRRYADTYYRFVRQFGED